MNQKQRNLRMWALFALLFLAALLVQTTLLGRVRLFGVKLNIMPLALVCIAMQVGHEAGGLFSLIGACFWYAAGGEDGTMAMVTYALCGILAGYLCDAVFPQRFFPAVLLGFAAVLLHEGACFCLRYYLGQAPGRLLLWVPVCAVLSLLAVPFLYVPAKLIRKLGGNP